MSVEAEVIIPNPTAEIFISKLKAIRMKNTPRPNSHRCQASSVFVLRREREKLTAPENVVFLCNGNESIRLSRAGRRKRQASKRTCKMGRSLSFRRCFRLGSGWAGLPRLIMREA